MHGDSGLGFDWRGGSTKPSGIGVESTFRWDVAATDHLRGTCCGPEERWDGEVGV
jgi:hypothetical protein